MAIKQLKVASSAHTAGIFADMTLDGPEIGTLVAVIDRAKNLPNRRTMGKQNPYCAMRLGKEAKKTETDRRGGQTPKWDQELRFTVHDCPDYYKLKCSVFNDDKRTDLIGEAWIDLATIIKPGGGSNDLWHQLNYKGKYAGDVRIELTYYDLRPREEKTVEKKKTREILPSMTDENTTNEATPRQLGPREVRRRPLPTSPDAVTLPQISPAQSLQEVAQLPPALPPKQTLDREENGATYYDQTQQYDHQPAYDPYANNSPAVQPPVQHYRQPFCEDLSPTIDDDREPTWNVTHDQSSHYHEHRLHSSAESTPLSASPHSWSDEAENWQQPDHHKSQRYVTPEDEYYPMSEPLSYPSNHSDSPYQAARPNNMAMTATSYRDSPLRHSMNQDEIFSNMVEEPESFDEPPPPPPMHRETPPRRQQPEYPPSAYSHHDQSVVPFAPRSLNVASRRESVEDRSPLQHIEHEYDPYSMPQISSNKHHERRNSYGIQQDQHQQHPMPSKNFHQQSGRHNSYDSYRGQDFSTPSMDQYSNEAQYRNFEPSLVRSDVIQKRSGSYDDRHPIRPQLHSEDRHSTSQPELSQSELYRPQPLRPRPTSSYSTQTPQRKAVSTEPYVQQDGRRLSAVPFGPDAYDVLNPGSSPVTNEGTKYQTPGQARESARLREVERLRDEGPIIGNDGRVIDPSDHLPSDTWAPEPERKNRRPEHVIHFRTKNDNRPNSAPNSAPASVRTHYHRQPAVQHSPVTFPASASPSDGRNRLQKSAATRPLPQQPYPQAPIVPRADNRAMPQSREKSFDQHTNKRHSFQEVSQTMHRPQLSEYQVPATNNYVPRGSLYRNDYVPPPNTHIQTGRDHGFRKSDVYDDPLAAEMSMIDIGPSRGGPMVLSNRRGY